MRWIYGSSLLLILTIVACQSNVHFEKSYPFDQAIWSHADTLDFTFEITDTTQLFDIALDVKHATDFPMQNLYVQFYTQFPSGLRLSKLVSLELADKAGVWFGSCNADDCRVRIPLQNGAFFNELGTYTITVEQYTRQKELRGVQSMGLALERSVTAAK
ncbi:MAG: gliding motility lipoprotein GldH [Bacteroidota bacterium]